MLNADFMQSFALNRKKETFGDGKWEMGIFAAFHEFQMHEIIDNKCRISPKANDAFWR